MVYGKKKMKTRGNRWALVKRPAPSRYPGQDGRRREKSKSGDAIHCMGWLHWQHGTGVEAGKVADRPPRESFFCSCRDALGGELLPSPGDPRSVCIPNKGTSSSKYNRCVVVLVPVSNLAPYLGRYSVPIHRGTYLPIPISICCARA